ncbi:hypothetical protein EU527_16590 [Candidatus Thorarchaeota archaeon]|nr:MAG: hypothetical protein EU527_16590 [Candidatus Thorarchaeota archaeon]
MKIKDIHTVFPLAWICKSSTFLDYVQKIDPIGNKEFLIADFASGEHDRVPSFFVSYLSQLIDIEQKNVESIFVYCTDIHALRLDSLMGKLEESGILDRVRVVHTKLELMDEHASLRPAMTVFFEENPDTLIWLDEFLIGENRFPPECFAIGILNNDIVGYMMEYYNQQSSAILGLKKVFKLLEKDGLLIVTMPCSLYTVDNIAILQEIGFQFKEGIDVDLETLEVVSFQADKDYHTFSRLNHYTCLFFTK